MKHHSHQSGYQGHCKVTGQSHIFYSFRYLYVYFTAGNVQLLACPFCCWQSCQGNHNFQLNYLKATWVHILQPFFVKIDRSTDRKQECSSLPAVLNLTDVSSGVCCISLECHSLVMCTNKSEYCDVTMQPCATSSWTAVCQPILQSSADLPYNPVPTYTAEFCRPILQPCANLYCRILQTYPTTLCHPILQSSADLSYNPVPTCTAEFCRPILQLCANLYCTPSPNVYFVN